MNGIWLVIKEAATSKKFIMSVAGAIAGAALRLGLDIPVEDVAAILSPIVAYILAQGWADRGKGAAQVVAIADATGVGGSVSAKIEAIKNV